MGGMKTYFLADNQTTKKNMIEKFNKQTWKT